MQATRAPDSGGITPTICRAGREPQFLTRTVGLPCAASDEGFAPSSRSSTRGFATQVVETDTDEISSKKPLAIALQPARTLSGRVIYADTGKPVPNVRVGVRGFDQLRLGLGAAPTFFDHDRS